MKHYAIDRTKHLSPKQFEALTKRLRKLPKDRLRDRTLLFLSMHTGARPQEILNLRVKDLDCENESVHIKGLKGSESRDLPLPSWLFVDLWELCWLCYMPTQKIFDIGYQRYRQIWQELGPSGFSLKALRHTFAIQHYKRTNNLMLIQTALGHRSISNTMVYAKYQMKTSQLRELLGV